MNYSRIIKEIEDDYNIGMIGGGRMGFSGRVGDSIKKSTSETMRGGKLYYVELIYVLDQVKVTKIILKDLMIRKEKLEKLNSI